MDTLLEFFQADRLFQMVASLARTLVILLVAYKEDVDHVMQVIREVADGMLKDEPYKDVMLESVDLFGVDKFADSAVIVKGRLKTQPIMQWMVGREFNRRIKRRFDELGIEIPFPHRTLYFGSGTELDQSESAALLKLKQGTSPTVGSSKPVESTN